MLALVYHATQDPAGHPCPGTDKSSVSIRRVSPLIRMKTSFGVLPRDCRMIVVVEPRGRPADVSRRPNQTTPEAVRDNQPSNNLPPSERSVAWMTNQNTTLQPFRDTPQVSICLRGWDYFSPCTRRVQPRSLPGVHDALCIDRLNKLSRKIGF